jgi:hypothetical protein
MTHWHYAVVFGFSGCYLPESHYGAFTGTTRRELADIIRDALAVYDIPAARFADVGIKNLWRDIKRNGSSTAHFTLDAGDGRCLSFEGLTEDEFKERVAEDERATVRTTRAQRVEKEGT